MLGNFVGVDCYFLGAALTHIFLLSNASRECYFVALLTLRIDHDVS